jgi:type IV secretory pathway VirJ component
MMKEISKAAALLLIFVGTAFSQDALMMRGKQQQLHLYGPKEGVPIILSSGDLGWAGLVVHVAEFLASHGYFVVGFNSRAYLSDFTTKESALSLRDVQRDYGTLVEFAGKRTSAKPILAGNSEGAGLSVLAASDRGLKERIQGILGLGLPNQIELGWRWQDFTIWITKKAPKEPGFMVADIIAAVSPAPLAEIHSTHDEFLPLEQAKSIFALAKDPKRMWIVEASNHRFGDNRNELDRCLLEALSWILGNPK